MIIKTKDGDDIIDNRPSTRDKFLKDRSGIDAEFHRNQIRQLDKRCQTDAFRYFEYTAALDLSIIKQSINQTTLLTE